MLAFPHTSGSLIVPKFNEEIYPVFVSVTVIIFKNFILYIINFIFYYIFYLKILSLIALTFKKLINNYMDLALSLYNFITKP